MPEWRIDPRNPGEVLACAGLAHLAWRADKTALTGFVQEKEEALRFVTPDLPALRRDMRDLSLERLDNHRCGLRLAGIELDWWCPWGLNHHLKNWAGQQSAWSVHCALLRAVGKSKPSEWLTFSAPAPGGRLYLDPDGTWSALGLGWSPNEHREIQMSCRPWVELLASIGLQTFPVAGHRTAGGFHYNLWRPAPLVGAVAAFGSPWSRVYALQRYHVSTGKTGSNTVLLQATPSGPD